VWVGAGQGSEFSSEHPQEGTKHLGNGVAKQYLWAKGNCPARGNAWGDRHLC